MTDDAMTLFNAMRPPPIGSSDDIRLTQGRPVPTVGGARDLHDLAMVPGSPAYNARIPRPPCYACGEDHFPGREYNHPWIEGPSQVHDEPVSASAVLRRPPTAQTVEVVPLADSARRLALYVGRGDTYVVAIETAPDWDSIQSFKVTPEQVLPLVNIARALGAKVADKTGGDLLMLEQEAQGASQHAQDHGRSPSPAGDRGPRQPGPDADGPQEDSPESAKPADRELPGAGRGWPDPAGSEQR